MGERAKSTLPSVVPNGLPWYPFNMQHLFDNALDTRKQQDLPHSMSRVVRTGPVFENNSGENELADSTVAIKTYDLSKSYSKRGAALEVIERVSFTVRSGEFLAILGPSGCGKSTLLRILAGLLDPTAGTATVLDRPAADTRLHRNVAMVFQQPALLPWRTARENVRLPGELFQDSAMEKRAEKLLIEVGLGEFSEATPRELSGGMQARTALARAWSMDPSILLMDEPFSSLDEITRQKMQLLVLDMWSATGRTIVFVTHSISEAVFLADRVLVFSQRPGRIVKDVVIDLPRPRSEDVLNSTHYIELAADLRRSLAE